MRVHVRTYIYIYIYTHGFGTAVGGRVSSGSHHIYLYIYTARMPALLAAFAPTQAKAVGALNMAPKSSLTCALCGDIAKPAIVLVVDRTKYHEAAEAKTLRSDYPVSRRDDGRIDLLVCTACYDTWKLLEAMETHEDDAHEESDEEIAEAMRQSRLEAQPADLDEELAEAMHQSRLEAQPSSSGAS